MCFRVSPCLFSFVFFGRTSGLPGAPRQADIPQGKQLPAVACPFGEVIQLLDFCLSHNMVQNQKPRVTKGEERTWQLSILREEAGTGFSFVSAPLQALSLQKVEEKPDPLAAHLCNVPASLRGRLGYIR